MSVFSVTTLDRLIESLDERVAASSRLASAVEQCCSAASSFKTVASSYASSFKGSQAALPGSFVVRSSPRVTSSQDLPAVSGLEVPGAEGVEQVGGWTGIGYAGVGVSGSARGGEVVEGRPQLSRSLSAGRSRTLKNLLAQSLEAGRESGVDCRAQDLAVTGPGVCIHDADLEFCADRPCSSPHPSIRSSAGDEFVDASDIFYDGSSSDDESSTSAQFKERSYFPSLAAYRELALQLQREIEKRRQIEGVVSTLQEELEVRRLCSVVPLSVSSVSTEPAASKKLEDEWLQKMSVARILAGAIAKGVAKAEAQEELEGVIGDKNRELSRYRDKIHYYETIIHEMSQINQQSIETARQRRRRRQKVTRWVMGSVGLAVCLGLSAAAVHRYGVWEQIKDLKWKTSSPGNECQNLAESTVSHDFAGEISTEM